MRILWYYQVITPPQPTAHVPHFPESNPLDFAPNWNISTIYPILNFYVIFRFATQGASKVTRPTIISWQAFDPGESHHMSLHRPPHQFAAQKLLGTQPGGRSAATVTFKFTGPPECSLVHTVEMHTIAYCWLLHQALVSIGAVHSQQNTLGTFVREQKRPHTRNLKPEGTHVINMLVGLVLVIQHPIQETDFPPEHITRIPEVSRCSLLVKSKQGAPHLLFFLWIVFWGLDVDAQQLYQRACWFWGSPPLPPTTRDSHIRIGQGTGFDNTCQSVPRQHGCGEDLSFVTLRMAWCFSCPLG